jgi:hypothetical protein
LTILEKKILPKRPSPRLSRAEFGSKFNGSDRLGQKSPHKARVVRPEGQHYLQKKQEKFNPHYTAKIIS